MATTPKQTLGTRNELISVPLDIISVRLKDGSFFGPKLYLGEDKKRHIEEGFHALDYNESELFIIQSKAWNRRRDSLLKGIDELKSAIKSAGTILEPVDLIMDGPYVAPIEGHRRIICGRWLQLEEGKINTVLANVITAGVGTQGNYQNLEYQMWYRNEKQPLSLLEKYEFIQEKLSAGVSKETFCKEVAITSNEYDSILLIAGQSEEVRSLIQSGLISPTTIKLAKIAADRKEWTQSQFESFIQDSVRVAEQLGKKKVTGELVQTFISEYKPPESNTKPVEYISLSPVTVEEDSSSNITTIPNETQVSTPVVEVATTKTKTDKVAKVKLKPTAKELEEFFIELMLDANEVDEEGEVVVYFTKSIWEKAQEYFDKMPDKLIEKLSKKKKSLVVND